jgi:hypothetical protein
LEHIESFWKTPLITVLWLPTKKSFLEKSMPKFNTETLRDILQSIHSSEELASHPWTESLFVREFASAHPNLSAGNQLLMAIGELFREMMPPSPVSSGVRLDARWSEFGFLAAKYFAPIFRGTLVPASFDDASLMIDESILFFVYGDENTIELSEKEIESYILIGDKYETIPASTLSDWHRKGLQRLLGIIQAREEHLALSITSTSDPLEDESIEATKKRNRKRVFQITLGALIVGFLIVGGRKVYRIYERGKPVLQDLIQLNEILDSTPDLDELKEAGPMFAPLQNGLAVFRQEVEPLLWITPYLGRVPKFGCELASSGSLLELASSLTDLGVEGYQVALPLMQLYEANTSQLNPSVLTEILIQAQPQLSKAQNYYEAAQKARKNIKTDCLSPKIHNLLINKIDPLLLLMGDGLPLARELPRLMGATSEGPKTYLLLVQNEDELRPTGGFITAVGTLLLENGQVSGMNFENSGDLDDWEKPYPAAPWQLNEYMNSSVLILRDTNWFTDYPIAALYAESLYSYVSAHSVDGVIAFDQQMLVEILNVTGPIDVEGVPSPVDSNNVIGYLRTAKTTAHENYPLPDQGSKNFMNKVAKSLVERLYSGELPVKKLPTLLLKVLNEHHLLLQFDNPSMTSLLARYGWDGAVRPKGGDFLMVVDSNIGFNKTNAVVESALAYEVDLTRPVSPSASLTVSHMNKAEAVICNQWNKIRLPEESEYPISDCYWNYLRVYMVGGAALLDADPQFVPANWMILRENVPAQVDILDEGIDGVQTFGTLQVIPGGESRSISFQFALPEGILVIQPGSNQLTYRLRMQKQPGTLAVPITIQVRLPENATILTTPDGAVIEEEMVVIETDLRIDRELAIEFLVE